MEWERILSDSVKDGKIRELHLRKLPVLKTTTNWKRVELIGTIDHQMKYTHYKGYLARLNDKLYFVRESTIKALSEFMEFNVSRKIQVLPD